MKSKAIVIDIDGVLLDVSKLYKKIEELQLQGQDKWDFFHKNANNAEYVIKLEEFFTLANLYNKAGYKIIILTSRRDLIAKSTLHYLLNGTIKLDNITELVFRPANKEGVFSYIYKKEEILKLQKRYSIELIIDDEQSNCAIFRQLGFNVLRVVRKYLADLINV